MAAMFLAMLLVGVTMGASLGDDHVLVQSIGGVQVAMSKRHIGYVNSALAGWQGSILPFIKAKKEVANDKEK
jgi:hypothetical protein